MNLSPFLTVRVPFEERDNDIYNDSSPPPEFKQRDD